MADSIGNMVALVVAAGTGSRMGTPEPKQYLPLAGMPILVHTLLAFERSPRISDIVLVVGPSDVDRCYAYREAYGIGKLRVVLAGGTERQHSVWRGLHAIEQSIGAPYVLIHDGVRPFVDELIFERIERALQVEGSKALVVAVPVKDTIKTSAIEQASPALSLVVGETLPRERLWAIQTPQAFCMKTIMEAHRLAAEVHFLGTDDAVLVERIGLPVQLVMGHYFNIKITTPEDLTLAEAIVQGEKRS